MNIPSNINMSKPNMAYASGVAIILILSLLISNIPQLAFSNYFEFVFRKQACIGLFAAGSVFGAITLTRYTARVKNPWKVPQSQVTIFYTLFFVSMVLALILAK